MLSLPPRAGIERLPEELLLAIIEYLDSVAPSRRNFWNEPNPHLTHDVGNLTLKSLSCVSNRWRRLVIPTLFKCMRLRLLYTASYTSVSSPSVDALKQHFLESSDSLLDFVQKHNISNSVQSFTLTCDKDFSAKFHGLPHHSTTQKWQYEACAELWRRLLSIIDPETVLVCSSPEDLAHLTNCSIDTFGQWAFPDMEYHILELRQSVPSKNIDLHLTSLDAIPHTCPGIADASILNLRSWTHLGLNEGSFLAAYGTYEYFERGPPSVMASVMECLISRIRVEEKKVWPGLESFSYAAIFPFAHRWALVPLLENIERLELQLAPTPEQYDILEDKQRVGRAELEDCWSELIGSYTLMSTRLSTVRRPGRYDSTTTNFDTISVTTVPDESRWGTNLETARVQKMIIRDFAVPGLKPDLEDIFSSLCLPVWGEYEDGVFTRLLE